MGLCFSEQDIIKDNTSEGVSQNIVDIQNLVEESAWEMYSDGRPKTFPKSKKKVRLELDWTGVKFIPMTTRYFDEQADEDECNILLETVFTNNSNNEQRHSWKTEQQTTATCKSSITKGYTTGMNVGLTLAAPGGVIGTTAGFSKGFTVESVLQNEDQRIMTWSADSVLLVGRMSKVTAKLQIIERKTSYKFETKVAVKGVVKGQFFKGKSKTLLMEYNANMRTYLHENMESIKDADGITLVEETNEGSFLKIEGKCLFKYGIKQEIVINLVGQNELAVQL